MLWPQIHFPSVPGTRVRPSGGLVQDGVRRPCKRAAMQFEEFIAAVGTAATAMGVGSRPVAAGATATWSERGRSVDVAVLAPHNISVALQTPGAAVQTTWYPIDAALVPIVAQRIARHLVQVAPSNV